MAPIATWINTKLKVPLCLPTLFSTTLSFVYLYSSFPFLTHTKWTLILRRLHLLFPLPGKLFLHTFAFIVVDTVLHRWDPSSEMKGILPYCWKCCQQPALRCHPPLGVASDKESCLSQGPVSLTEQPTCNCQRGINAYTSCPNSRQLWKDISATESPGGWLWLPEAFTGSASGLASPSAQCYFLPLHSWVLIPRALPNHPQTQCMLTSIPESVSHGI